MEPPTIMGNVGAIRFSGVVTGLPQTMKIMSTSIPGPPVFVVRTHSVVEITRTMIGDVVHHPEERDVIKIAMEMVSVTEES